MVIKVFDDIYDGIRKENIIKYGTDINIYGPTLLANLYSDRTHFIYELLQNAEDACIRAKKEGMPNKFTINFKLFVDRLEVRHNGIPFDENDVRGICGISAGTKEDDSFQIGKFGIGFKSVYAYTKSPEIYSGDKSFCINNYVQPFAIETKKDIINGDTLFVIPFNHDQIKKDVAHNEIRTKLIGLGLRTLLFLRNINEISWQVGVFYGAYTCTSQKVDDIRWVNLLCRDGEYKKYSESGEKWLVLEKNITDNQKNQQKVEIAYLINKNLKLNKEQIVPTTNTDLVVFFPTTQKTHLNFIIHGPYDTTPARDQIRNNSWNKKLIVDTAALVAESISTIKKMDLLDVSYLNTLPIDSENPDEQNWMFSPIYRKVKEILLSGEKILPTHNGGYISAEQALIVRGKGLRDILSSEQISLLFKINNVEWLEENITHDKNPKLHSYLLKVLNIKEIDVEQFASNLTEDFIKEQTDDWITKFYGFLLDDHESLWRKKTSYDKEGILRSKPIIRLNDKTHSKPFESDGEPLAYLPSKFEKHFPTIKDSIVLDEKAKAFLKEKLGLTEPDIVEWVLKKILPQYVQSEINITEEKHLEHIETISDTLESSLDEYRRNELLDELRKTSFLMAINPVNKILLYKKPTEIYLGDIYTENEIIEAYFEGNSNIWFLDGIYKGIIDRSLLKSIGCKAEIQVKCKKAGVDGNVTIVATHGHHEKGLGGFDPDCEIDGLKNALENINISKSEIIWNILKIHHKQIFGVVESSGYKSFKNSQKEEKFSKVGFLLTRYSWLKDKDGIFHKPSEIQLFELSDEFDKECSEAEYIAEKLQFENVNSEPDAEKQYYDQLPPEKQKRVDLIDKLYEKMPEEKVNEILEKLIEDNQMKDLSPESMREVFEDSLDYSNASSNPSVPIKRWSGITPEEEEQIRMEKGKDFLDSLKKINSIIQPKIGKDYTIVDTGNDPKDFLREQYDGHCQICNIRLDIGNNKAYFITSRITETCGKNQWTDAQFNVLCLCPNCHALMKHGNKNLKNIREMAEKVLKREVASEEVDERKGDFYIINIDVVGASKEIFYTPAHMAELVVFIEQTTEKMLVT